MTESTIYWITRFDEIKSVLGGIGIVLTVFSILCVAICGAIYLFREVLTDPDECKATFSILRKLALGTAILVPLAIFVNVGKVFIPSTRDAAAIRYCCSLGLKSLSKHLKDEEAYI